MVPLLLERVEQGGEIVRPRPVRSDLDGPAPPPQCGLRHGRGLALCRRDVATAPTNLLRAPELQLVRRLVQAHSQVESRIRLQLVRQADYIALREPEHPSPIRGWVRLRHLDIAGKRLPRRLLDQARSLCVHRAHAVGVVLRGRFAVVLGFRARLVFSLRRSRQVRARRYPSARPVHALPQGSRGGRLLPLRLPVRLRPEDVARDLTCGVETRCNLPQLVVAAVFGDCAAVLRQLRPTPRWGDRRPDRVLRWSQLGA